MANNVHVLDLDIGPLAASVYGPLLRSRGISGRAQTRIARKLRVAIKQVLTETLQRAYLDGSAPNRTGRSKRIMMNGVRAFGTSFASLRGYIVGPAYIAAHENGATILPKRARQLTIPLPPALRADGSPKLPSPNSWRNVLNTFIYKSKKTGNAYIAYKNTNDDLVLLYVFVDSAQLSKYTGFLSNSFDKSKPDLLAALGSALLFEMSQVDLLSLARITYRGRSSSRRRR